MYLSILKEAFIIWGDSCSNVLHKINIVCFFYLRFTQFQVKGIIYICIVQNKINIIFVLNKINIISEKEKENRKKKKEKEKG